MTNNLFIKKKKLFYRWDISLKYSYCFLFIIETARYIWKCFTLRSKIKTYDYFFFFQAILFYTPRWLWKGWEGGKIHALMMDLDIGLCSEVEKKQKKKMLLDYLWENLRFHNWWAYRYYLCEVLALLNVVGEWHDIFPR